LFTRDSVWSYYSVRRFELLLIQRVERSDELANLLVGHGIPAHITGLPSEVMASPFGQMLLPQLRQMEAELNSRHQHSVRILSDARRVRLCEAVHQCRGFLRHL